MAADDVHISSRGNMAV